MVLWSSGNGGRGRILSSKRILLSGSLLLLVLFYYVVLPGPQAGSLDARTVLQTESAFHKYKKGNALADDTEIVMPLPVREDGSLKKKGNGAEALPKLDSVVERVKLDRRLPVTDNLRGGVEASRVSDVSIADCGQDSDASDPTCMASSSTTAKNVGNKLVDTGMDALVDRDPLAGGTYEDALLGSKREELEVMEDDERNAIDVMNPVTIVEDETTSNDDEWSDEKEAESIQEEDDDQGSEKEDGTSEDELLDQFEKSETFSKLEVEAKARVEEVEEVLEEAIEELSEERMDQILDETEEEILDRIEEAKEESGGVLTDEMVRKIEEEVVAEEEASLDENQHRYAGALFHGDGDEGSEDEEGEEVLYEIVESELVESEIEVEYKKEDLLGQAGSGETMSDEE
ncbi:hypothetical protein BGZ96_012621 [Linnemannia gamsii]|uniref:Uncharacterized protein n=1 Tax=Linnemannia gamsii TaxID=64522 RepID=A0ABQ7JQ10_9FUNG|nr:hypothetical protein BGZ96_012621 [Linnemannia gamsii]